MIVPARKQQCISHYARGEGLGYSAENNGRAGEARMERVSARAEQRYHAVNHFHLVPQEYAAVRILAGKDMRRARDYHRGIFLRKLRCRAVGRSAEDFIKMGLYGSIAKRCLVEAA